MGVRRSLRLLANLLTSDTHGEPSLKALHGLQGLAWQDDDPASDLCRVGRDRGTRNRMRSTPSLWRGRTASTRDRRPEEGKALGTGIPTGL